VSEGTLHSNVWIEPARPEHLAEIAALAEIIWRAHYPGIISREQIDYMLVRIYDVEVMQRELTSGTAYDRLLVRGQLRGFASHGPTGVPGELKLHKLYIHPDYQRQGLGASLLKHVERAACDRGFTTLVLAVNKKNTKAIAAYRKHGFAIRESVVVDIGGGFVMDDYVMVKVLS
jgi:ribosomal protein S18 acetylase RimI-like enzyme